MRERSHTPPPQAEPQDQCITCVSTGIASEGTRRRKSLSISCFPTSAGPGARLPWIILAVLGRGLTTPEPKRLARLSYLVAREKPGRTHERTVHTLTNKGLLALRVHAGTPVTFTPLKSDPLRLLICDLVGEYATRESMATLRDDIADSKPASRRRGHRTRRPNSAPKA